MCHGTKTHQVDDVMLGLLCRSKRSVVELVKHPRVDSGKLLHGEVDLAEALLQTVQQQPGYTRGDGRSVAGPGQLAEVQPLAAQTLLSAEADVVGERAESAGDVHVRHAKGVGVVVLLPDAQQRSELGANASFLKDFPNGGGA